MKPLSEYSSVGDWKEDVEKEGYITGTQVCWGLSNKMKKNHMTFAEAYDYLLNSKMLFLSGKHFMIAVRATQP
jgi:hypothetical protein